jgi:hypothetical protein
MFPHRGIISLLWHTLSKTILSPGGFEPSNTTTRQIRRYVLYCMKYLLFKFTRGHWHILFNGAPPPPSVLFHDLPNCWVGLSSCTQEVLGLNFGRDSAYPDRGFSRFSLVAQENAGMCVYSVTTARNSSFISWSTIWRYVNWRLTSSANNPHKKTKERRYSIQLTSYEYSQYAMRWCVNSLSSWDKTNEKLDILMLTRIIFHYRTSREGQ